MSKIEIDLFTQVNTDRTFSACINVKNGERSLSAKKTFPDLKQAMDHVEKAKKTMNFVGDD